MPSHFKVKEYCPLVFRNLRERFGIDDHDYMVSRLRGVSFVTPVAQAPFLSVERCLAFGVICLPPM